MPTHIIISFKLPITATDNKVAYCTKQLQSLGVTTDIVGDRINRALLLDIPKQGCEREDMEYILVLGALIGQILSV